MRKFQVFYVVIAFQSKIISMNMNTMNIGKCVFLGLTAFDVNKVYKVLQDAHTETDYKRKTNTFQKNVDILCGL